jgi:hypothetical protein
MNIKGFLKGILFRLIAIYSIFIAVLFASITINQYVADFIAQEQGAIITYGPLYPQQIAVELFYFGLLSWLTVGGLLSLKKDSEFMAITLLIGQMFIEFLAGFTIGLFFMPVTFVLIISLIGYKFITARMYKIGKG